MKISKRNCSTPIALFEHRVDGLIVATTVGEDGKPCRAIKEFYGIRVPTVFVDRSVEGAQIPSVCCDHPAAAYEATVHLIRSRAFAGLARCSGGERSTP